MDIDRKVIDGYCIYLLQSISYLYDIGDVEQRQYLLNITKEIQFAHSVDEMNRIGLIVKDMIEDLTTDQKTKISINKSILPELYNHQNQKDYFRNLDSEFLVKSFRVRGI